MRAILPASSQHSVNIMKHTCPIALRLEGFVPVAMRALQALQHQTVPKRRHPKKPVRAMAMRMDH